MKAPQFRAIGLLAFSLLSLRCTGATAPVQPTVTDVTPASQTFSLSGSVTDTAYRSLIGARVEVIDGPRAATVTTVDEIGHFSLPGTFTGTVRIRASHDGYVSQTQAVSVMRPGPPVPGEIQRWVAFFLELPGPSIDIAGEYSLRLTADGACTNWPDQARARTYTATITANSPTSFRARLRDARFFSEAPCPTGRPLDTCTYNQFGIGVASDYASMFVGVIEQLSEGTYLIVDAGTAGSFGPAGITAPLSGSLVYCPTEPVLIDQGTWACLSSTAVECDSTSHQLALVPR